jgi:hypothetical protein
MPAMRRTRSKFEAHDIKGTVGTARNGLRKWLGWEFLTSASCSYGVTSLEWNAPRICHIPYNQQVTNNETLPQQFRIPPVLNICDGPGERAIDNGTRFKKVA